MRSRHYSPNEYLHSMRPLCQWAKNKQNTFQLSDMRELQGGMPDKYSNICTCSSSLKRAGHQTCCIVGNCSGQIKNWCLLSSLLILVNSAAISAEDFPLKYFEHTFMSADSFHHGVDQEMRRRPGEGVFVIGGQFQL